MSTKAVLVGIEVIRSPKSHEIVGHGLEEGARPAEAKSALPTSTSLRTAIAYQLKEKAVVGIGLRTA